nr:PASTA domain-containing protein [Planctomycetota bacterium]
MRVTLPDQVAAAGDTLFVLEIEFPEARPAAEKIEVTTTGDIEALDLRGTGAGGTYEVHPGLQGLHVPLRVTEATPGEAKVQVDWTDHTGQVTSEERTLTLEAVADAEGSGAGAKLAVVGLLVAGLVALGVFVAPGLFGGGKVPDVSGQQLADARQALEDAGYVVAVDRVPVDDRRKNGVVLRTDPKAGDKRQSGAEVRIQVGSLLVDVQTTVGLAEQDAVQTLEGLGLQPIVKYADAE